MDTALVATRILLALVFATAGVGKLLDLSGTREAVREFGVPDRYARIAGPGLPAAELLAALLLIFSSTAQVGALLALALLLLFVAGIANALRQGMAPDCHCFGQIHSAPAGAETLVRNIALAGVALFTLVKGPGPSISDWLSNAPGSEVAAGLLGVAAGLLALFAFQLWTEVKQLSKDLATSRTQAARAMALAPPGLPVGTEAPDFELQNLQGEAISLDTLRAPGLPILLMFASPGCGSCTEIFPSLRRWQQTLSERLTVAVISNGGMADNQALLDEHGLQRLLVQEKIEVMEAYNIRGTPSAVLVTPDGRIGTVAAESVFEIEPMVRHVLRGGAEGTLTLSHHGAA